MDAQTELEAFCEANAFVGWLFLTMLMFGIGLRFGVFGVEIAAAISIFIAVYIARKYRIQALARRIYYLQGLKKAHMIRPCLINEAEVDGELFSLRSLLQKKYHREVIL